MMSKKFFNFNKKNKIENIIKIDLHSHINFNIDDGCKSIDDSILLLNQASNLNIKYIACTSHQTCLGDYYKNLEELNNHANKLGITLVSGNELVLDLKTHENLENNISSTINDTNYVLVEVISFISNDYIIKSIENLVSNGYIPILAHPERMLIDDMNLFREIKEKGALLQLNASSLDKDSSNKKRFKIAINLLKNDLIDIISSDAHDPIKRNYDIYENAYEYIVNNYNDKVQDLFYNNPLKIIKGEIIKK